VIQLIIVLCKEYRLWPYLPGFLYFHVCPFPVEPPAVNHQYKVSCGCSEFEHETKETLH
jgi:hypothetical protein